jgi:hypothetical protein
MYTDTDQLRVGDRVFHRNLKVAWEVTAVNPAIKEATLRHLRTGKIERYIGNTIVRMIRRTEDVIR